MMDLEIKNPGGSLVHYSSPTLGSPLSPKTKSSEGDPVPAVPIAMVTWLSDHPSHSSHSEVSTNLLPKSQLLPSVNRKGGEPLPNVLLGVTISLFFSCSSKPVPFWPLLGPALFPWCCGSSALGKPTANLVSDGQNTWLAHPLVVA